MDGEDYPAIKAACEGRQLPAYEAASDLSVRWLETWMSCWKKPVEKKGAEYLERWNKKGTGAWRSFKN